MAGSQREVRAPRESCSAVGESLMLEFHHFGIACTDIAVLAQDYEKLGYTVEGAPFVDEIQKIKGLFITGGGPRLELLAAHNNSTVLTPWLSSGPRIYHQAFWVDDIN